MIQNNEQPEQYVDQELIAQVRALMPENVPAEERKPVTNRIASKEEPPAAPENRIADRIEPENGEGERPANRIADRAESLAPLRDRFGREYLTKEEPEEDPHQEPATELTRSMLRSELPCLTEFQFQGRDPVTEALCLYRCLERGELERLWKRFDRWHKACHVSQRRFSERVEGIATTVARPHSDWDEDYDEHEVVQLQPFEELFKQKLSKPKLKQIFRQAGPEAREDALLNAVTQVAAQFCLNLANDLLGTYREGVERHEVGLIEYQKDSRTAIYSYPTRNVETAESRSVEKLPTKRKFRITAPFHTRYIGRERRQEKTTHTVQVVTHEVCLFDVHRLELPAALHSSILPAIPRQIHDVLADAPQSVRPFLTVFTGKIAAESRVACDVDVHVSRDESEVVTTYVMDPAVVFMGAFVLTGWNKDDEAAELDLRKKIRKTQFKLGRTRLSAAHASEYFRKELRDATPRYWIPTVLFLLPPFAVWHFWSELHRTLPDETVVILFLASIFFCGSIVLSRVVRKLALPTRFGIWWEHRQEKARLRAQEADLERELIELGDEPK